MALPAQAQVFDCPECQYKTILGVDESITGVRGYAGTEVVLTGSYVNSSGVAQGQWWLGSLETGAGTAYPVSPVLSGQTVTSSIYYGPNTALFDPSLGNGNIRVVGSYQYAESPPAVKCPSPGGGSPSAGACNHGVMYTGPVSGIAGTWMQIDVPSTCAGGTVANTIPHSTMGDLVVGNYDLLGQPGAFNAFIYNIARGSCTPFNLHPIFGTDDLITAYGIWQNGIGSSDYTIAGGARHEGLNTAFLVDYNPATGFSNLAYFGEDSLVGLSHFEGITGRDGGYNLVGTVVGPTDTGAVFASIDRRLDGSFGRATWVPLKYPDSGLSTGNTVYQNYAMGIYTKPSTGKTIRSYVVRVPGPVQGQVRSGTAIQVGTAPAPDGSGRGSLRISGVFTFEGPINLAAAGATVRILAGLNEGGSGGDLVLDDELTLGAAGRNTATTARFKSAPGVTPGIEVTIGSRGRGQFNLLLDMSRATIDVPAACPRPELATVIEVDDGTNRPLRVAFDQSWQCLQRGGKVEYLRAP
jgi:hypothetical protein